MDDVVCCDWMQRHSADCNLVDAWLLVDAGVGNIRLRLVTQEGATVSDRLSPSNTDLRQLFAPYGLVEGDTGQAPRDLLITGKLGTTVRDILGRGQVVLPSAALWLAARDLIRRPENGDVAALAMLDLSASGYLLVGVDRQGELKDDLLLVNPRCGAGAGINIDRVLQKLGLRRADVDQLLSPYLGVQGAKARAGIPVRADRCGVFSSSATISDKNQGIPLDVALATTLKSEVLKACRKIPPGFDQVYLSGRIFCWQYARACAEDYLHGQGVTRVSCDTENNHALDAVFALAQRIGADALAQPDPQLNPSSRLEEYPSFASIRQREQNAGRYLRLPEPSLPVMDPQQVRRQACVLALDVGSTMAKAVLADAATGDTLFLAAYSNAGDTIETVKQVFSELRNNGLDQLRLTGVGVTGSARYQVQQALSRIYPQLEGHVQVLVENYAHARGSLEHARLHLRHLRALDVEPLEDRLCVLIDIGGEDTKISTVALGQGELFDNAMNVKCSAGTGSLMDTLSAMFGMSGPAQASAEAFDAQRAYAINATCAVFLMENARKLQARGVAREEILASANWAIVENMARTLWGQLELPGNSLVLLHGQTMRSEALPLAVTERLQAYLGTPVYALVPPFPGHRACFGLIHSVRDLAPSDAVTISLSQLLETRFEKKLIHCHGAACGDPGATCNRCSLSCHAPDGHRLSFSVGGCTAINELLARKDKHDGKRELPPDAYSEIWNFIDQRHPRSDASERLVIPRSFAVSEWAYLLARCCEQLGLPVHVDNVRAQDLLDAQPLFNVDTCAPQIGAAGQFRRLAAQPHGYILAPQIVTLPTGGVSAGMTCTSNQGGVAVAKNLAELIVPAARIHLFQLDLDRLEPGYLAAQFGARLQPVFAHYGIAPDAARLEAAVRIAIADHLQLRQDTADLAAELSEQALAEGRQIALVVGREYILNPGIYDSHVQRLLRDKQMTAIPSYVLDLALEPDFDHVYWRNPHFIVTVLHAVAERTLHQRLTHPRLREILRRIETGGSASELLPVVQVSTFACGPDSMTAPFVAEIMKQRPFLLIQTDAVIKELAHLENRVNTYVKQLQQGLHGQLHVGNAGPFRVRMLRQLVSEEPLNRDTDVLYFPTLSDNRVLSAPFRGAGYTCIDNYDDDSYDLAALVKAGRKVTGDAVCAPLAAMYADLARAVDDFVRRKQAGDPIVAGKSRLLYFDSRGGGPCRQGQYPAVHQLLYQRQAGHMPVASCNAVPGGEVVQFLVPREQDGYNAGFDEWLLLRAYQGAILQGVLHDLLFTGGAACRDRNEYLEFQAAYRQLKAEIYQRLEAFHGPGRGARWLLRVLGRRNPVALPLKYLCYRLHGREFAAPLRRFAERWLRPADAGADRLRIWISGEGYMRVAQSEDIFRILLATLGFRRFRLGVTPVMSFLEYLLDEAEQKGLAEIEVAEARRHRDHERRRSRRRIRRTLRRDLRVIRRMRFALRQVLARPMYRAAGLPLPAASVAQVSAARVLLPTARPLGELAPYVGEALTELRQGVDLFLNVGPNGCMVSTMGEAMTPRIQQFSMPAHGRIQNLFSADGDVNEELLTLAVLKAMGPEHYYQSVRTTCVAS